MRIRAIIADFDGTLVDTFEANFQAYKLAFSNNSLSITRDQYKACFGLRFDAFMKQMGIDDGDIMASIKKDKAQVYPQCFDSLVPNTTLIAFVRKMKLSGVKTAIASTAQKENLMNVLNHLHLEDLFDEIIAGILLHDVIEDCRKADNSKFIPEDLPVNDKTREIVRLMSHEKTTDENRDEVMKEYYKALAGNPEAALVKCITYNSEAVGIPA